MLSTMISIACENWCLSFPASAMPALAECKRVTEQNDRLRHLLQQLRRAQFGRKSEHLDPEQLQLAIEDLETTVAAEAAEQARRRQ